MKKERGQKGEGKKNYFKNQIDSEYNQNYFESAKMGPA